MDLSICQSYYRMDPMGDPPLLSVPTVQPLPTRVTTRRTFFIVLTCVGVVGVVGAVGA